MMAVLMPRLYRTRYTARSSYSIGQVTISPPVNGRNRNTSESCDGRTTTLAAGQQALHEDGVGQAEALSLDGVGLAGEARHVGTPGVERAEHLLEPGRSLRGQVAPLGGVRFQVEQQRVGTARAPIDVRQGAARRVPGDGQDELPPLRAQGQRGLARRLCQDDMWPHG